MAVVAVMLLSTALPGEAQAGKVREGLAQGPSKSPADQVERAFDGDSISRRAGPGESGNRDRPITTISATIGGEKYPQRGAAAEMAAFDAFATTEINAIGLLSAFSIVAGALGLVELFRRNAA